jgi:anti-anti-sigma factor
MDIPVQLEADKAKITLPHAFDIAAQGDFRQAYSGVLKNAAVKAIEIDFNAVGYIDSSALGSLLLLRQRAEDAVKNITFMHCQPEVMKTLTMANFHRIFDIHRV